MHLLTASSPRVTNYKCWRQMANGKAGKPRHSYVLIPLAKSAACGGAKSENFARESGLSILAWLTHIDLKRSLVHTHTSVQLSNFPRAIFLPVPVNAQYTSLVTITTGTSSESVTARSLTGAIPTNSAGPPFPSPVQQLDTHQLQCCIVRSLDAPL
jgi:hypothetical protein